MENCLKGNGTSCNGNPYQTIWFYVAFARQMGTGTNETDTSTEKKFCEMHPKNQVIQKGKACKMLTIQY